MRASLIASVPLPTVEASLEASSGATFLQSFKGALWIKDGKRSDWLEFCKAPWPEWQAVTFVLDLTSTVIPFGHCAEMHWNGHCFRLSKRRIADASLSFRFLGVALFILIVALTFSDRTHLDIRHHQHHIFFSVQTQILASFCCVSGKNIRCYCSFLAHGLQYQSQSSAREANHTWETEDHLLSRNVFSLQLVRPLIFFRPQLCVHVSCVPCCSCDILFLTPRTESSWCRDNI